MASVVVTNKVNDNEVWVRAECNGINHTFSTYSALKTYYKVNGTIRIYKDSGDEMTEDELVNLFAVFNGFPMCLV